MKTLGYALKALALLALVVVKILFGAAVSGATAFVSSSLVIGAAAWLLGAHDVRSAAFALSIPLTFVAAFLHVLVNLINFVRAAREAYTRYRVTVAEQADE